MQEGQHVLCRPLGLQLPRARLAQCLGLAEDMEGAGSGQLGSRNWAGVNRSEEYGQPPAAQEESPKLPPCWGEAHLGRLGGEAGCIAGARASSHTSVSSGLLVAVRNEGTLEARGLLE